jgi:hypothetical protein
MRKYCILIEKDEEKVNFLRLLLEKKKNYFLLQTSTINDAFGLIKNDNDKQICTIFFNLDMLENGS